jgi:hypothetical protein
MTEESFQERLKGRVLTKQDFWCWQDLEDPKVREYFYTHVVIDVSKLPDRTPLDSNADTGK